MKFYVSHNEETGGGEEGQDNFNYDRTVSNGEVWSCDNCNNEILIFEKPNEDHA